MRKASRVKKGGSGKRARRAEIRAEGTRGPAPLRRESRGVESGLEPLWRKHGDRSWRVSSPGRQECADPPVRASTEGAANGNGGWRTRIRGQQRHWGQERSRSPDGQEVAGTGELVLPRTIGQQAIVTDSHEAGGHDVQQEAT